VLRVYCKSLVARLYEKFATFVRLEIRVNRMKDLGLNKGLENIPGLRQRLMEATDRLAGFEAEMLSVHVDFLLFQRLALPITLRPYQDRRHQDPGHAHDPLDGGATARRSATPRLADGPNP
jgi:hypothetical protein